MKAESRTHILVVRDICFSAYKFKGVDLLFRDMGERRNFTIHTDLEGKRVFIGGKIVEEVAREIAKHTMAELNKLFPSTMKEEILFNYIKDF